MLTFDSTTPRTDPPASAPGPQAPREEAPPGMQAIVFASQKGGSGKTTLCGQLAVQAELAGQGPVALIDTDPQGSLAEWWNARAAATPLFVKTDFAHLSDDLGGLRRRGVRLVLIDTPPAVTETIREVVGFADLVVVPTRPSPHDLRAVGATLDIVEGRDKPLVFAVNGATVRARITGETAVALSQHGTVAPTTVHQRIDFATSMIDGRAVMELNPDSRSAAEVAELWRYLASRLVKIAERRRRRLGGGDDQARPEREPGLGHQAPLPQFGRRPPIEAQSRGGAAS